MSDELPFTVAITVQATVEAVDFADAASIAEDAVKQALRGAAVEDHAPLTIQAKARDGRVFPVTVHGAQEVTRAIRNGRLYLQSVPPRQHTGESQ